MEWKQRFPPEHSAIRYGMPILKSVYKNKAWKVHTLSVLDKEMKRQLQVIDLRHQFSITHAYEFWYLVTVAKEYAPCAPDHRAVSRLVTQRVYAYLDSMDIIRKTLYVDDKVDAEEQEQLDAVAHKIKMTLHDLIN
ncbi:MAG: hypothetical protein JWL87_116 [Candidatus Adlerbacteria bacterium]|nr:hypothetical protein [Candidatus Adlerbacteria bacterium]